MIPMFLPSRLFLLLPPPEVSGSQGNLHIPPDLVVTATRGRKVDCLASCIDQTVVPSTVSYADVREGNDRTEPADTVPQSPDWHLNREERCICEHQAETGLDGWYGEHM